MMEETRTALPGTKHVVAISTELTSFVGRGPSDCSCLPPNPVILGFGDIGEPAVGVLAVEDLGADANEHLVVLAVSRSACARLFALLPKPQGRWYLPADLRGLGHALLEVEGEGEVADMLRAARSTELLCGLFAALQSDRMVEVPGATTLNEEDIGRVAAANRLINEHWQERLTVSTVARRCGLGKQKLTRGFRELYRCSVSEALIQRRLQRARELLIQSDLPVSTIGYDCGYSNSASFTRAFARGFGIVPTELRRRESAGRGAPGRRSSRFR